MHTLFSNSRTARIALLALAFTLGSAWLSLPPRVSALAAPQETIHQVYITNITDISFTVSWTTDELSNGQVEWGPTPDLGNTTADPVANTTTHSVEVSGGGVNPLSTYYFQVRSGATVDDNGGAFFTVTTGPTLTSSPGSIIYYGFMFQSGGVTPVQNGIVYLQIQDANGSGSPGASQWLSARTENTSGTPGVWNINLVNARLTTLANYFSFSPGDQVRLIWQGGLYGCIGESPSDTRLFTIPSDTIIQVDMNLDNSPTAVSLHSFSAHPPAPTLPAILLLSSTLLAGTIAILLCRRRKKII